jgi:cobalamin biosynthesis protein CobC
MIGIAPAGKIAHGGSLAEARRLFPGAPEPVLDLSTGINPLPYPLPALAPECFTRLPEPADLAALQETAAAAYGVRDPAMVAAAPGTQILIELLPRLLPAGPVAVLAPTYAEHAAAWRRLGRAVSETTSFEALAAAGIGVLCNPNNPDGERIAAGDIVALADRLAMRGGMLVVDEAFADLEPEGLSVAGTLPHPGIVVLRSFGKTYGLAGIRLGFALAAPGHAAAIRAALGAWPVSGIAIAAGRAALADAGWRQATASRLAAEAARLDALLAAAGCAVIGGTRLFRLARHPDAPALFARLGRRGIFVRRFADRPDRLRFGLPGSEAAWERLRQALADGSPMDVPVVTLY